MNQRRTVGFSIGDIKGDTLYVHIEKATRNTNGSYEAVNKAFASRMLELHPELVYVNREDDGGDEGLRQAKRSYHPIEVLKNTISFFRPFYCRYFGQNCYLCTVVFIWHK